MYKINNYIKRQISVEYLFVPLVQVDVMSGIRATERWVSYFL
jgi:hypothetical protein